MRQGKGAADPTAEAGGLRRMKEITDRAGQGSAG